MRVHRITSLLRVVGALAIAAGFLGAPIVGPTAANATFPDRNGRIAFQVDTGNGNQIFTVQPDGKGLFQVTHLDDATTPDWSPDGRWIAFTLNECSIARIRPDGTGLQKVPSPGGCEMDPAFTPDGHHVVFERDDPVTGLGAIWVMRLDGSHRKRLGTGPGGAATPEISPDGQTVTFLSYTRDDLTAIFGVSIHGGPVRQVTPTLWGMTFKHDWAPDGSRLVMSDNAEDPDRTVNLLTIRPDGTGLQYLTDWQTPDLRALAGSYSPDGRWIVYRQVRGDVSALTMIRADGHGSPKQIMPFSDFTARFIDWGPATG